MKKFNVTGTCVPLKHYMVDISGKLEKIIKLVDDGCYFTISRARQYGKTTTLSRLQKTLPAEYICARISFQGIGDESFESAEKFCAVFLDLVSHSLQFTEAEEEYIKEWKNPNVTDFPALNRHITNMCKNKKVVLMIDEVDRTSHNRVFLNFISMLRDKFLLRTEDMDYTFHSVILAGVYDIKNIKLKLINEGLYTTASTEGNIYNSPWNIAVNFDVDMSFGPAEISTMLKEYEADYNTGMDITAISGEIYDYTSGYPFLVSRICQYIDEELDKNWTADGVKESVKLLIEEKNTLFDDLSKNLENSADLYNLIYEVLIVGSYMTFNYHNPTVNLGFMYGIIKKGSPYIIISNKIFEMVICEYFISKDEEKNINKYKGTQHDITKTGRFDMELCLRKFAEHYAEIFNKNDIEFLERHGRLIFLSYLKPLINGQGFYHIESQFTDLRRMDIVVDFGNEQFIIELKLWRGEAYEKEAYEQLLGYMESKKADTGYILTFDFRKESNKEHKTEWLYFDGKKIFEVIV